MNNDEKSPYFPHDNRSIAVMHEGELIVSLREQLSTALQTVSDLEKERDLNIHLCHTARQERNEARQGFADLEKKVGELETAKDVANHQLYIERREAAALQSTLDTTEATLSEANTRYEKLRAAVKGMAPADLELLERFNKQFPILENQLREMTNLQSQILNPPTT